VFDV
jgi:hypothetical protein